MNEDLQRLEEFGEHVAYFYDWLEKLEQTGHSHIDQSVSELGHHLRKAVMCVRNITEAVNAHEALNS